jgi:hypothetical protein
VAAPPLWTESGGMAAALLEQAYVVDLK